LVASGPRFEDSPAVPGETLVVSITTKSATVTLATEATVNVGKLMAGLRLILKSKEMMDSDSWPTFHISIQT
jgi:hypothetical protein